MSVLASLDPSESIVTIEAGIVSSVSFKPDPWSMDWYNSITTFTFVEPFASRLKSSGNLIFEDSIAITGGRHQGSLPLSAKSTLHYYWLPLYHRCREQLGQSPINPKKTRGVITRSNSQVTFAVEPIPEECYQRQEFHWAQLSLNQSSAPPPSPTDTFQKLNLVSSLSSSLAVTTKGIWSNGWTLI